MSDGDMVEAVAAEQAVMVCPQCEGEGGYADGLDEAACHTECTRCGGNGWIVDRAALSAIEGREGWQDISTAPRDREVLLYCAETGEQFVAFWGTNPEDSDTQWVFASSPAVSFIVRDPTHWRPLPAPPSGDEG